MDSLELAGVWTGLAISLLIFSMALGDHWLARLGQHLLVGAVMGYAALMAWQQVLLPGLILPLLANPAGDPLLWPAAALVLLLLAAALERLQVDGLVLGFLRDGEIDLPAMQAVLAEAPHLHATFHRAFEALPDPLAAIRTLKTLPQIDHILTSGGERPWVEKVSDLAAQATAAGPEIALLLGGGLTADALPLIRERTPIREFHVGRAARVPAAIDGIVEAERVAGLKRLLADCSRPGADRVAPVALHFPIAFAGNGCYTFVKSVAIAEVLWRRLRAARP